MTQVLFLLITQSPEINSLEIDAVSEWCLEPRTATGKGFNFLLKLRVGTFCTYSVRGRELSYLFQIIRLVHILVGYLLYLMYERAGTCC